MSEGLDAGAERASQAERLDEQQGTGTGDSVCPRCDMPVAESARFCRECGSTLREMDRCIGCGSVLGIGVRHCYECGQRIF